MASASGPISTPTMGLPVFPDVTMVVRRPEASSPKALGSWIRRKTVAGGSAAIIRGMPCAFNAMCASPNRSELEHDVDFRVARHLASPRCGRRLKVPCQDRPAGILIVRVAGLDLLGNGVHVAKPPFERVCREHGGGAGHV